MLTTSLNQMRRRLMSSSLSMMDRPFTHSLSSISPLSTSLLASRLFSSKSTASSTSSSASSTSSSKSSATASKKLFRLDDFPFFDIQPKYNTPKSSINQNLELEDIASRRRIPSKQQSKPWQQVMGKPPYKAKSPFTSMTVHKKGMSFHSPYGKDLITINESALSPKEGSKRKVLHQRQIKQNIRRAKDPKLGEVARNVTEPGQPLWQPEPSQIKRMKLLRIRQGKPYLMLHRDLLNTDRDREALVRGKVPFGQYNFHKFVRLPKPPGGKDWAQIGREQGRPEESLHPEGFRMPITDKGEMEWLRNYRLSREKIRREQEEEHMVDE